MHRVVSSASRAASRPRWLYNYVNSATRLLTNGKHSPVEVAIVLRRRCYSSTSTKKAETRTSNVDDQYNSSLILGSLEASPAEHAPGTRCCNRYAFVTGGSSGIGYATAKRFVNEGADRVVILTRDADRGEKAAKRIKEETGLADAPISILVSKISDRERIAKAMKMMPLCNTIVNSAGISQSTLLLRRTLQQDQELMTTNLQGPMFIAAEFLRNYLTNSRKASKSQQTIAESSVSSAAKSHCIVNVSSLLAIKGGYGASAYAASKAGLIAFTRALSIEAAEQWKRMNRNEKDLPPFRANVVVPGYIDTPMITEFQGKSRQSLEDQIPLGRFGTAEEVADAILFLVENEYANNCVLNLDGGLSAT